MVKMSAIYLGEKHCKAEHGPSHCQLETDAPKDNQGRGENFSPTDLVATALGTCILTTMAIAAEKDGVDLKNSKVFFEKEMGSNPRKISKLKTQIELPEGLSAEYRKKLENIALNCPVKLSLHPDVHVIIEFL